MVLLLLLSVLLLWLFRYSWRVCCFCRCYFWTLFLFSVVVANLVTPKLVVLVVVVVVVVLLLLLLSLLGQTAVLSVGTNNSISQVVCPPRRDCSPERVGSGGGVGVVVSGVVFLLWLAVSVSVALVVVVAGAGDCGAVGVVGVLSV